MASNFIISITILNPAQLQMAFDAIEDRLKDLSEPLLETGMFLSEQWFNKWGDNWEPLAESTVKGKAALGFDVTPLVRSEALIDAVTDGEWSAAHKSKEAEAVLAIPGYGKFHLSGTRWMPARNFLPMDSAVDNEVVAIFSNYIFGNEVAATG